MSTTLLIEGIQADPTEPTTEPLPTHPDVDPGGEPTTDPLPGDPADPDESSGAGPAADPDTDQAPGPTSDPSVDPNEPGTDPDIDPNTHNQPGGDFPGTSPEHPVPDNPGPASPVPGNPAPAEPDVPDAPDQGGAPL